jgi:UDP-N-acetylmuramate dehydrogenase
VTIRENVPLAPYTTLGVGGPARWFVEAWTEDDVVEAVQFARERGLPLFVLGGGSNLLVSDEGFPGLVLRACIVPPEQVEFEAGTVLLTLGAGMSWDDIVRYATEHGYAGIECLAGIPGDVGGTPVQNIGAYGQEVAETIVQVRAYDLVAGVFVELDREACGFGYRRSIFNSTAQGRYIVTAVSYRLRVGGAPTLKYADLKRHFAERLAAAETPSLSEVYDAVRAIRAAKGMLAENFRSAGSFFKNPIVPADIVSRVAAVACCRGDEVPQFPSGAGGAPADEMVKLSAAWLIERAGFHKGFRMGNAGISSKHTLALVNLGGASAAEIVALRDAVMHGVEQRFAIRLEQEPVMLGFADYR